MTVNPKKQSNRVWMQQKEIPMRKLAMSVALGLAALVAVTVSGDVAQAHGGHGRGHEMGRMRHFEHRGRHYHFHSYGREYRGWSRYCWFPQYRCYGYYCPTRTCWYYYSTTYTCYVPCTYMTTLAPTAVDTNTNTNVNVNVNNNNNNNVSAPVAGLPTGATALAPGFMPAAPK
jgi:hypothetical protein